MIPQITPQEAHELLKQNPEAAYLDVRTVPEFEAGHPVGAFNVPVLILDPATGRPRANQDFERAVTEAFAKDRKIIVGCQAGSRSQHAAEIMQALGFSDVSNLLGGFGGGRDESGRLVAGWADSGLPIERGTATPR